MSPVAALCLFGQMRTNNPCSFVVRLESRQQILTADRQLLFFIGHDNCQISQPRRLFISQYILFSLTARIVPKCSRYYHPRKRTLQRCWTQYHSLRVSVLCSCRYVQFYMILINPTKITYDIQHSQTCLGLSVTRGYNHRCLRLSHPCPSLAPSKIQRHLGIHEEISRWNAQLGRDPTHYSSIDYLSHAIAAELFAGIRAVQYLCDCEDDFYSPFAGADGGVTSHRYQSYCP